MIRKKVATIWSVLKNTFTAFMEDRGLKLSASLSYYTVFSLGPLLVIIISLAGIFMRREDVQHKVYGQITSLLGKENAVQVQEIIQNVQQTQDGTIAAIVGAVILFIGASGVFTEMQDSINFIWSVKAKPKKGWLKFITNRLISFSLVIGLGFILLVSLIVNALLDLLNDRITALFADFSVYLVYGINIVLIMIVISTLFAVIFKVLPDATIAWKDAFIGASFTAILFMLGKFAIGYYLGNSKIGLTYGAAASIIVVLTWVYYSSIILYFGAEFTKMYAIERGAGIQPNKTAVFIIKKEAREIPESTLC